MDCFRVAKFSRFDLTNKNNTFRDFQFSRLAISTIIKIYFVIWVLWKYEGETYLYKVNSLITATDKGYSQVTNL